LVKKLDFAVKNVEFLEEVNDSQFATAAIEAFSSGDNLHDLTCSVETLRKTASTIYEKPVIFELDGYYYDFGTHNDGITVPAGFVVPGSAEFVERDDGRISLKVIAKIWKRYAKDFVKIFQQADDKKKKVSVEMEIYEQTKEDAKGMSEMLSFAYTAICVLGDFFTEASPGANMQMVSFSSKVTDDYDKAYRLEFDRYSGIDFSVPSDVRDALKRGLDNRSKFGSGGTAVSASLAKNIIKSKSISPEQIRQIYKYFSRKNVNRPSKENSESGISWDLYGGDFGYKWSKEIVAAMNHIDDDLAEYFAKGDASTDIIEEMTMKNKEELETVAEVIVEDKPEEKEFEAKSEGKDADAEEKDEDVMMEEDSEDDEKEDEESEEEEMVFAMTSQSMNSRFQKALSEFKSGEEDWGMYWVADHDGDYVYVYCYEDNKYYRMGYEVSGMDLSVNVSRDEEVMFTPELVGVSLAKEKEFSELKEFKANVEKSQFEFEVSAVLDEVAGDIGSEELELAREESKNFSLDTIDGWKNAVRAKAFAASKGKKKKEPEGDGIRRMDSIFVKEKGSDSIW